MAQVEDASKLLTDKEILITELATPSVELDEDENCYYAFIYLYAPDERLVQSHSHNIISIITMLCAISQGNIFRDSPTAPRKLSLKYPTHACA